MRRTNFPLLLALVFIVIAALNLVFCPPPPPKRQQTAEENAAAGGGAAADANDSNKVEDDVQRVSQPIINKRIFCSFMNFPIRNIWNWL